MSSTARTRATTVAASVAIAAGAVGVPLGQASAAAAGAQATENRATENRVAENRTTHRAAMRLADQPLAVDRRLAHTASRATTSHLVRTGDTLGHIARRYGTTVRDLQAANELSGNRIYAGDRLTIPARGATDRAARTSPDRQNARNTKTQRAPKTQWAAGEQYTVRPGDTLSGIAKAKHVTVRAIRSVNARLAGSTQIFAGETITLPRATGQGDSRQERRSSAPKVGKTFAGRTYADDVTKAAQANKDELHNRQVPSRKRMRAMVAATASAQGVDPRLAQAIAYQESGFNMRAVSPANAVGVMQVIPSSVQWASQLTGQRLDALDPQDNVLAGVTVMKANLRASNGDLDTAIAGYYQGLRSVNRNGMYADTKTYVASVKTLMGRF